MLVDGVLGGSLRALHFAVARVRLASVTACLASRYVVITVLGLVGGAPGGETPRVADASVTAC